MKISSLRKAAKSSVILLFLALLSTSIAIATLSNLQFVTVSASSTQYQLTIEVVGSGTTEPSPGNHTYDAGTRVPVDALPDTGWMLDHWLRDGVDVGDADPYTVTMNANRTLTAHFIEIPPTAVAVDPTNNTANPDEYFTINITVANVTDLYSWAFKLRWKTGLLSCSKENITEGAFLATGGTTVFTVKVFTSYIDVGCMLLSAPEGVNGSGTMATATFKVLKAGNCTLDLYDVTLVDSDYQEIPSRRLDGTFHTTSPVASYMYSPHPTEEYGRPIVGETVTFNATTSFDPDQSYKGQNGTGIMSYSWDFDDDTPVVTETDPIITHVYDTAGGYRVILNVTDDDGETSTVNQPIVGTTVNILLHDIAVIDVTVASTSVSVGATVAINVTVLNDGSKETSETLNVTVYANMQPVQTKLFDYFMPPATSPYHVLSANENETTTVAWDTTGFSPGDYTISVEVYLVHMVAGKWVSAPGIEQDLSDNEMVDGNITLVEEEVHDLAVTNVEVGPTLLELDEWSYVRATVENNGNVDEHYNATIAIYLNASLVKTTLWSNETLHPGATTTLEFTLFRATSTTKEGSYNITASVILINATTLDFLKPYNATVPDDNPADNWLSVLADIRLFPVAHFTYSPATPVIEETVTFDATGSYAPGIPGGTIDQYAWDFGDGNITTTSTPITSHVYKAPNTYTVTVTVTDDEGLNATTLAYVKVSPKHPVASFTYLPAEPWVNETVTFDASASYDLDGTIVSYEWDFGDGTTATGMVTNNTYVAVGTYTATLTVTDNDALTDTTTANVTVSPPTPPPPPTTLYVYPPTSSAMPGEIFTVKVMVSNVEDLSNWQVLMTFDSSVVEAIDITQGDFLAGQPEGTIWIKKIATVYCMFGEATKGKNETTGEPYPGVSGSGWLGSVEFQVNAIGETVLNITNPDYTYLERWSIPPPYQLLDIHFEMENGYFTNLVVPPVDTTPPTITVNEPTARDYLHSETITLDFGAVDTESGVASVSATLNGMTVESGDSLELFTLSLGTHTLTVTAVDNAGNSATETVELNVIATVGSLQDLVNVFYESGYFNSPKGIRTSLIKKLCAAEALINRGKADDAKGVLGAFINQLEAQSGKHVSEYAANILITDAQFILDHL